MYPSFTPEKNEHRSKALLDLGVQTQGTEGSSQSALTKPSEREELGRLYVRGCFPL